MKNRREVIENIRLFAESGEFHKKVETQDPVLTPSEEKEITDSYIESRTHFSYRIKRAVAVSIANLVTKKINRDTEIIGIEKIPADLSGVIITSNHFGPLENTVIRHLIKKLKRKNLAIISQVSNFRMKGAIGFLMNYADTVPISKNPHYLVRDFMGILKERLCEKGDAVLLYPEGEMWFNYRKPRPPKDGAYFYASKLSVPIISCFVEIIDTDEPEGEELSRVKYRLHVLDVLYPDENKSVRENTEELSLRDYNLKKDCYEMVYGKPLTYDFDPSDIGGFCGKI